MMREQYKLGSWQGIWRRTLFSFLFFLSFICLSPTLVLTSPRPAQGQEGPETLQIKQQKLQPKEGFLASLKRTLKKISHVLDPAPGATSFEDLSVSHSPSNQHSYHPHCQEEAPATPDVPVKAEERWFWRPFDEGQSTFTDPRKHHPENFQYLVFALRKDYQDNWRSHFRDPSSLQRLLISSSVINHERPYTYTPCGFILKVPAQNIYSAHLTDMGLNNSSINNQSDLREELNFQYQRFGLRSPQSIIQRTEMFNEYPYNEVAILGTSPQGNKVKIDGIFLKYLEKNGATHSLCEEEIKHNLKALAEALDLPIVRIVLKAKVASPLANGASN